MHCFIRKTILAVALVLFCRQSTAFGQIQNEVQKVLATTNFVAFKEFSDSLADRRKGISCYREYLRDVAPGFKEGVFKFERFVSDNPNTTTGSQTGSFFKFRVTVITSENKIVYYSLSEEKSIVGVEEGEIYYSPIAHFKDESQYLLFKQSFESTFGTALNERELFITDFVYGNGCGIIGTPPEGQEQIEKWVKSKNKTALLKWLRSANTEKQVYAISGLFQLKKRGIKITREELKIIQFVRHKEGHLQYCTGCLYGSEDIRRVTGEFEF